MWLLIWGEKYLWAEFLTGISIFFSQEARVQELEEEHSLLQTGLQVIEKARKWYFKRITAIQEEKLHLQNGDQHSLEQVQNTTITTSLYD